MKHYFDIDIAKELGINAAIVFENLAFWINHNRRTGRNNREGHYWTYGTHKDIAGQFDYLSVKQIRTALERLENAGYIRSGCFNRLGFDKTKWYTLGAQGERVTRDWLLDKTPKADAIATEGTTIPDIIPDSKPIIDPSELKRRALDLAERCGIGQ